MIEKEDAIKALEEFADSMTTIGGSYIRTAIKQAIIPLPDHGGGVAAEDTISRKLALEICDWYEHEYTEADMYIKCIAEDLKNMPAAEPQITECEQCLAYDPFKNGIDGFCRKMGKVMCVSDFCSSAERRQDETD